MRLIRYVDNGHARVGAVDDAGVTRSLAGIVADLSGATLSPKSLRALEDLNLSALPVAQVDSVLPPITGTSNFLGVGLNYRAHAAETSLDAPSQPLIFQKAVSSISGPYDDVVVPSGSTRLDHEVELAIVIGTEAWQVPRADALSVIAGFTICNDISDRGWQFDGPGQWTIGKSAPTFGPLGPWLVTPSEVDLDAGLKIELAVNDETFQSASTRDMIFDVPEIIEHVTRHMRLLPGDVIATGTPEGVGLATDRYLALGDVMTLSIAQLGHQRQVVV